MPKHFIHIGMPRTGSTFLQTKVFPKLSNVSFYGLPYTHFNHAFSRMLFSDESLYDPTVFSKEIAKLEGEKILLSNENFIGQSMFWAHGNRTRIAERLSAAMPDATIILFIRNQLDLLRSLYAIGVYGNIGKKPEEFFWQNKPDYTLEEYKKNPAIDWEDYALYNTFEATEHLEGYDYLPLIELYKKHFPNVEVFLFEQLQHEPEKVAERLQFVLDTKFSSEVLEAFTSKEPVNSGVGHKQATWLRQLNRFHDVAKGNKNAERVYYRSKRFIMDNVDADEKLNLPEQLRDQICNYFRERNKEFDLRYPKVGMNEFSERYCR